MIEGTRLRHLLDTTETDGDRRCSYDDKSIDVKSDLQEYLFQWTEVYDTVFLIYYFYYANFIIQIYLKKITYLSKRRFYLNFIFRNFYSQALNSI